MLTDEQRPCGHATIEMFSSEDGAVKLWACAECRIRFYPHDAAERSDVGAALSAAEDREKAAAAYIYELETTPDDLMTPELRRTRKAYQALKESSDG